MLRAVHRLKYSGDLRTAGTLWVTFFTLNIIYEQWIYTLRLIRIQERAQISTINYIFLKFPAARAKNQGWWASCPAARLCLMCATRNIIYKHPTNLQITTIIRMQERAQICTINYIFKKKSRCAFQKPTLMSELLGSSPMPDVCPRARPSAMWQYHMAELTSYSIGDEENHGHVVTWLM